MNERPRYTIGQASLVGDRHGNQDRCIAVESDDTVLLGLGDGMGGHPKGEVAAQTLIDICSRLLHSTNKPVRNPAGLLERILQTAHEGIQLFGQSQEPAIDPRTTAVVAMIQNGTVYWAHAGDSRFYLLRDGRVLIRTIDHSYVERLRQQGIISEDQQENHPQRNFVTRCLGGKGALPELTHGSRPLRVGDTLLLCSDGLWGSIDEATLCDRLDGRSDLAGATAELAADAARRAHPESDNVTLIALRVEALGRREQTATPPAPQRSASAPKVDDDLASAVAELKNAIDQFEQEIKQEKS